MHALIVNGAVDKYPYTIGMLRKDNPNTSFPKRPTDELLAEWGLQPVAKIDRPTVDHTKNVSEGTPVAINGTWTQVWEITDATVDEIAERNEQASAYVRSQRDRLLSETDWVVVMHTEKGTNIPLEWETYRQALRDITTHANWPYLSEADWPTAP